VTSRRSRRAQGRTVSGVIVRAVCLAPSATIGPASCHEAWRDRDRFTAYPRPVLVESSRLALLGNLLHHTTADPVGSATSRPPVQSSREHSGARPLRGSSVTPRFAYSISERDQESLFIVARQFVQEEAPVPRCIQTVRSPPGGVAEGVISEPLLSVGLLGGTLSSTPRAPYEDL